MNITEHEMRGLLAGRCLPDDMRVNDDLPAYLFRKFAALKAERDALAVECAQYKSLAERFAERADDYKSGHFGYSVFDSSNEFKQHIKTPATDTYLNSVRADAVREFAHHQRVIADSLSGDVQRSHRITACRAEDFANQLRAGEPS